MPNNDFIAKFSQEIKGLVETRNWTDSVERNATKGSMLEVEISHLMGRYLPNRCGFGTGHIHDSFGGKSKQMDIIIFDRDSVPPACAGTLQRDEKYIEGFFPIECCWYAIEIKKKLNNTELRDTVANMQTVKSLQSRRGTPPTVLFAYSSDLKEGSIKEEFERYKKIDQNWNKYPAVTVFCILGKGYLFAYNAQRIKDRRNLLIWKYIESQKDSFEAACFFAGVINTITGQPFGSYLFDENDLITLEEIELS